jgi:hypothetical protein
LSGEKRLNQFEKSTGEITMAEIIGTLAWSNGTDSFVDEALETNQQETGSFGVRFSPNPPEAFVTTFDGIFGTDLGFTRGVYSLAGSDLDATFEYTGKSGTGANTVYEYEMTDGVTFVFEAPSGAQVEFELGEGTEFLGEQNGRVEFELQTIPEKTIAQWTIEGEPKPYEARDVEFTFGQTIDSTGGGYQIEANGIKPPVTNGNDKKINSEINTTIKFDTDIDFDKKKDVDIKVKSESDVKGNLAELLLDAEALGINTLVEVDSAILTVEDKLSSVVVSGIAASDSDIITPPVDPTPTTPVADVA